MHSPLRIGRGAELPTPVLTPHDVNCPSKGLGHSDAAKRVSDTYRLHRLAEGNAAIHRWIAVALADGRSDGVLYDSKTAAVRHQHHNEQWYAFICLQAGDMSPCEAEQFLVINRMFYDKGIRMTDPDLAGGGPEVIPRATVEDQRSLIRSIRSNGRTRPSGLIYPGE